MTKISLGQDKYAMIDDEDYPYISRFKWFLNTKKDNFGVNYYYASRRIGTQGKRTEVYMYQFLIALPAFDCIIFKNKNTLDYRKKNLVAGTFSLRLIRAAKRKNLHSQYKGVTYRPYRKLYEARVAKNGKQYYCGSFNNEESAAKAYDKKAKELYGELAYQNFKE